MVGRFMSNGVLEENQLTVESNFRESELLQKTHMKMWILLKFLSLRFWVDLGF